MRGLFRSLIVVAGAPIPRRRPREAMSMALGIPDRAKLPAGGRICIESARSRQTGPVGLIPRLIFRMNFLARGLVRYRRPVWSLGIIAR